MNPNINVILQRARKCSRSHDTGCVSTIKALIKALNDNVTINMGDLCSYLHILLDSPNHNYGYQVVSRTRTDDCIVESRELIKELLKSIFTNMPHFINQYYGTYSDFIKRVLHHPFYDECFNYIELQEGSKIDETHPAFVELIARLSSNYHSNNHIANFIIKNIQITPRVIVELAGCKNEMLANFVGGILDKTDILNPNLLTIACGSLPFTMAIVQSLVARNVKIEDSHIIDVLTNGDADSIQLVLDLARVQREVIITKDHYRTLLTSRSKKDGDIDKWNVCFHNNIVHSLNISYELNIQKHEDNYTVEKMMILINCGYVPDREDILLSVSHKKEIPMIEKFDIKLDQDFLKLCQNNGFYPKYNFQCISTDLLELQSLCLKKNLPKIRDFLKKHKDLVPDSVCMENASKIIRNEKTIALLINSGGIVTKDCLTYYANLSKDPQLTVLLTNFLKNK
jgi:hypothetical protein